MQERYLREEGGFTLIEVLLVVVVIGILAAIAIPSYTRIMEKAKGEKAITNLKIIFTGERMYLVDNNTYTLVDGNFSPLAPDYIENPNANPDRSFDYTIPAANATTFTAKATRNSGSYNNEWIQIDQTENITTSEGWPFTY